MTFEASFTVTLSLVAQQSTSERLSLPPRPLSIIALTTSEALLSALFTFAPALASDFADKAKENGFGVIICAAGMAAHLAGVIAGHTTLPVIGIPCKGANFDGMDALLATVQMPSGIPVATVAVDGAKNAAILAIQMLALSDECLAEKLEKAKQDMIDGVVAKDKALQDKLAAL